MSRSIGDKLAHKVGVSDIPEIKVILRVPADDNTPKIRNILESLLKEINKSEVNLGYIKEEKGIGKTVEEFYKVAEDMNEVVNLVDSPLLVDEIIFILSLFE